MNRHDYYEPLSEDEIQALRCLIDRHYYKDVGGKRRVCVNCGKEEPDDE